MSQLITFQSIATNTKISPKHTKKRHELFIRKRSIQNLANKKAYLTYNGLIHMIVSCKDMKAGKH